MDINKHLSKIELEDWYISDTHNTTSLYFIAPKEMLNGKYPEAEFMTIGVEFPTDHPEARYASVCCSPTKHDEVEDSYTDYDWFDVDMSYEDIEKLFELAKKTTDLKGE